MAGKSNGRSTQFEAYANYQSVSDRVARSIDKAVDAYSMIQADSTTHSGSIGPEEMAEAKHHIVGAATRLVVELEENREVNETFDEILGRWKGSGDTPGRLKQVQQWDPRQGVPGWMYQFIIDIRRAGWHLGYVRAGMEKEQTPDDPHEKSTQEMLSDL